MFSCVHLDVVRSEFAVDLETTFEEGFCGLFGRCRLSPKNRIISFGFSVCHDHEFNSNMLFWSRESTWR